jgi:arylsulfatase A-like enzyme
MPRSSASPERAVGSYASVALAALALLALSSCQSHPDQRAVEATDVVFIVVDTLRADHVSLYGYPRATTPQLEAFAHDAVVYENAISPGTWTVPAHAAMFTGMWPSYAGAERVAADRILTTPIDPRAATLAELLQARGFRTAAFVANTTYVARVLGFHRGFDEFFDWKLGAADGVRNALVRWLEPRSDRVFVFANILDPHEPYEPPKPYDTRFPGADSRYGAQMTSLLLSGVRATPEIQAHFVSRYDGEVAFTDEQLGALFADLKRVGRYDGALVIVTSDHGELLGEHGLAGHGLAPYEQLVRVPLMVKYPRNARAGSRVARRVSTLGVFATIFAQIGAPLPPNTQSRPLDDEQAVWVEDVDVEGHRVRVGYEGTHKLVTRENADVTTTALYDLAADPGELHPIRDGTGATALRTALRSFEGVARPVNDAQPPIIEPERERQLRLLGYIQ